MSGSAPTSATTTRGPSTCPPSRASAATGRSGPTSSGWRPVDRYDPWPVGLDSHSEMLNLTRGLVKRGYSDEDVVKILGGNWLRLFRETW